MRLCATPDIERHRHYFAILSGKTPKTLDLSPGIWRIDKFNSQWTVLNKNPQGPLHFASNHKNRLLSQLAARPINNLTFHLLNCFIGPWQARG
jgi:hypothetical protein